MINNSLPPELLEKIFKIALKANSLIWDEVDLYSHYNKKKFQMYKHLIKPGIVCEKYIRKLNMDEVKLWPICIVKMLQAYPSNIQKLNIKDYQYYSKKDDVRDLLSKILHILPNLRKLDIRYRGSSQNS
ncbi:hypothetical protein RhiirC2_803455 [Rhizophagus irregularis]|uniref:Uncharacterized protein n=1 Tax=Rhizophagus irregularis TaxID=588596 RepID=A0A2N1LJH9_9GLOM|nr:hypothetical protein RhiirC2_803455 [Rhizophagus irregularis]